MVPTSDCLETFWESLKSNCNFRIASGIIDVCFVRKFFSIHRNFRRVWWWLRIFFERSENEQYSLSRLLAPRISTNMRGHSGVAAVWSTSNHFLRESYELKILIIFAKMCLKKICLLNTLVMILLTVVTARNRQLHFSLLAVRKT